MMERQCEERSEKARMNIQNGRTVQKIGIDVEVSTRGQGDMVPTLRWIKREDDYVYE